MAGMLWCLPRRLTANLSIKLCPNKGDVRAQIEPEQQDNNGAERAVSLVVSPNLRDVDSESYGAQNPKRRRHHRSPTDPSPFWFSPVRGIVIDDGQCNDDDPGQNRPADKRDDITPSVGHRQKGECCRQHRDEGERRGAKKRESAGQRQGTQVETNEAALLFLAIADVDGGHQDRRRGPRAPKRKQHTGDKANAEPAWRALDKDLEPRSNELDGFGR